MPAEGGAVEGGLAEVLLGAVLALLDLLARLVHLLRQALAHQAVLGLKLLEGSLVVVDEGKPSGTATT